MGALDLLDQGRGVGIHNGDGAIVGAGTNQVAVYFYGCDEVVVFSFAGSSLQEVKALSIFLK